MVAVGGLTCPWAGFWIPAKEQESRSAVPAYTARCSSLPSFLHRGAGVPEPRSSRREEDWKPRDGRPSYCSFTGVLWFPLCASENLKTH